MIEQSASCRAIAAGIVAGNFKAAGGERLPGT